MIYCVLQSSLRRFFFTLLICSIFFSSNQAQEQSNPAPAVPQSQSSQEAKTSAPAKPGVFYDKDLELSFNYPVEMQTRDMMADMDAGHMNLYGSSGQNDPEHREAKRCIRPLLDADLPEDKAPKRLASLEGVWVDDTKEYKDSYKPEPIFAKIVMVELDRACLPKKLQKEKNTDDVLRNMAVSAIAEPGIQVMPQPIWYEIGKQKIHMNSGAGRPIVNGQLSPAPVIMMAMATEWRGHLLEWVFSSNDTVIFNEITKSLVRFGDGPWSPMFAPNIGPKGSGTPITVLPK